MCWYCCTKCIHIAAESSCNFLSLGCVPIMHSFIHVHVDIFLFSIEQAAVKSGNEALAGRVAEYKRKRQELEEDMRARRDLYSRLFGPPLKPPPPAGRKGEYGKPKPQGTSRAATNPGDAYFHALTITFTLTIAKRKRKRVCKHKVPFVSFEPYPQEAQKGRMGHTVFVLRYIF